MKFTKRLVLTNREYEELIASLDSHVRDQETIAARIHDRRPFRMTNIPLCVQQPDGGQSYFFVYGRNISPGGISILHGGFLHHDSDCRLILRTRSGDLIAVAGIVRHCRLVEQFSHEVGIQFLEEINPRQFMLPGADSFAEQVPAIRNKAAGTILVVDSFEPDRRLLEHHLHAQNYRTVPAATSGAALDAIKSQRIDLVLSGLDLVGEHGLYLVQMMRQQQFTQPVILSLSDNHPDNLALASQAGANDVLLKPVDPDLLAAQVDTHLGRSAPRGSLVSRVQTRPGMRDLVAHYVEHLRRLARRLRRAYGLDDVALMRECCCRIKGSALSFGFPALTVAALRAITAIDHHGDAHEARVAIRQLLDCCDRVKCPSTLQPAIQPVIRPSDLDASSAA